MFISSLVIRTPLFLSLILYDRNKYRRSWYKSWLIRSIHAAGDKRIPPSLPASRNSWTFLCFFNQQHQFQQSSLNNSSSSTTPESWMWLGAARVSRQQMPTNLLKTLVNLFTKLSMTLVQVENRLRESEQFWVMSCG